MRRHTKTFPALLILAVIIPSGVWAQKVFEPEMVKVEGGTFMMGNADASEEDEKPLHEVKLDDFYIGKYEVTERAFAAFAKATELERRARPGWHASDHPAINVSWTQANAYCKWLSEKTGKTYRLPTEAEWEYAAKGGQKAQETIYSGSNHIDKVCVYYGNAQSTKPVGSKQSNELGIYDMSGNAWEWCHDRYDEKYYKKSPRENPTGPEKGNWRVVRGGSWVNEAYKATITFRDSNIPRNGGFNDGLRLVREVE